MFFVLHISMNRGVTILIDFITAGTMAYFGENILAFTNRASPTLMRSTSLEVSEVRI